MTFKAFFRNVFTSGQPYSTESEIDQERMLRYIILNTLIFLGVAMLIVFAINAFNEQKYVQGIFNFISIGVIVGAFVILRHQNTFLLAGLMSVISIGALYGWLAYDGGVQGSGVLWAYSYPVISIFILGRVLGVVLSLAYLAWLSVCILVPDFALLQHPLSFGIRVIGVYLVVFTTAIVYEQIRLSKDRALLSLTNKLKSERDQMEIMKEKVADAIFLINSEYKILRFYSKKLEHMLEAQNLEGALFADTLGKSLKENEKTGLHDYFDMVLKETHDPELLKDVNPLQSFNYIDPKTGEIKFYKASFTKSVDSLGNLIIVCTLRDETEEKRLAQLLAAEEQKRSNDMEAFFEIVQVDPRFLEHFIEETKSRFKSLNKLLENRQKADKAVLSEIFQGLHATKSNAVLLGLRGFSQSIHELESVIKDLRDQPNIEFQSLLSFTLSFEKLQGFFDKIVELADKLKAHQVVAKIEDPEEVFRTSVQKMHDTLAAESSKSSKLSLELEAKIPPSFEKPLRDIAVQLVRNALVHGIETDRQGKPSQARIRVRVFEEDNKICLRVSDDGRGIDFAEILAQARTQGLVKDGDAADKVQLTRLLFSEGFSTQTSVDEHAGRGVGLSLVQDTAKKMGGQVRIKTEKSKGTIFEVSVPLRSSLGDLVN